MPSERFDEVLPRVLRREGGYVEHPADPGGATKFGITPSTLARARGRPVSAAEVRELTQAEAADIYRRFYWEAVRADALPPGVDEAVFDLAVHSGPGRAVKLLQRLLGVAEDGIIGPKTLAALAERDPASLVEALAAARLAFLQRLPTWPVFGRGWSRRVREVKEASLAAIPPDQALTPKETSMDDVKSIFASRTVWTNIVGLIALALAVLGYDTRALDAGQVAEAASQLIAAASFILSTFFRIVATRRLL